HETGQDDLARRIDTRLRVARVVPALVTLRHHLHFRVGEVALRLVVGHVADRPRLFAATLASRPLPLFFLLCATPTLLFGLGLGLLLQPLLGLLNDRQAILAPLQFLGQFVTATRAQRGI